MMASLRGRLYVGLAAIVLLAGLAAGAMAFRWAYHEANEFQDAFLLQIGALAVNNRIQTGPAVEHGVDTEARVIIEELGRPPLGVDASLPRLPDNIPDGLQALMRGKVSWRILVRNCRCSWLALRRAIDVRGSHAAAARSSRVDRICLCHLDGAQ